jgi:uncharacterized protein
MPEDRHHLRAVREIENVFITLADGCRLAARIWLPADADAHAVPAILEYIPYRKRDSTAPRDQTMHPKVAAHGYACVRVDIRGNGDSQGLMFDEYLPQELADGCELIAWLAAQPWCSGRVGMIGISWGGFNALQIAALRPPALAAVISVCSTDDRYADDIHYRGSCLLADNLAWSATMMAYSSRPPDPLLVGDAWRAMWLERLEHMPFLAANWLAHQHRDAFWRHGSVAEDFSAIEVPVLAVGGWADPYSNAIFRLVAGLGVPASGLIGPWGHKYPQLGVPGPAMDFTAEMVAWWDRWLARRPSGEVPPALRAYMLDGGDNRQGPDERPGFWVGEAGWPSPHIEPQRLFLTSTGGLALEPGAAGTLCLASPLTTGMAGGRFYPRLGRPDLALDQRPDDAGSLTFDGSPLAEPLDLLGAPVVDLDLAVDQPQANIAVRLCHVAPDGTSHRITMGVLNLCHHQTRRDSDDPPAPLELGRTYGVSLQLDEIGYRVPAGHRLRLAISTAYWPMLWPSPAPVTLTLNTGASRLDLPVRHLADQPPVAIERTEIEPMTGFEQLRPPVNERRVTHDGMTGETVVEILDDAGLKRIDGHGLECGIAGREIHRIRGDDPLSARTETVWTTDTGRGDWRVRTLSTSSLWADALTFHLEAELVAFENDQEVFRRRWRTAIPRDHV